MADISIIGGINIDIEGCPFEKLRYEDSNPGKISVSFGGVGRNITENIVRLNGKVAMFSVAGDDFAGRGAKKQLEELGVDVSKVILLNKETTAMYLSILNHNNDMEVAICNMDILDNITPSFIDSNIEDIKKSKILGLDCNLKFEILDYITTKLKDMPMFLDPVSVAKAGRVKDIIGRFHTIKPNRLEAEVISGMKIDTNKDLQRAGEWFVNQGVKKVFISLSEGGVFYKEGNEEGIIHPENVKIVSATGAGDAFSAAIMLGYIKNFNIKETARYGMAAAEIAMESKTAVNENISEEEILRRIRNV